MTKVPEGNVDYASLAYKPQHLTRIRGALYFVLCTDTAVWHLAYSGLALGQNRRHPITDGLLRTPAIKIPDARQGSRWFGTLAAAAATVSPSDRLINHRTSCLFLSAKTSFQVSSLVIAHLRPCLDSLHQVLMLSGYPNQDADELPRPAEERRLCPSDTGLLRASTRRVIRPQEDQGTHAQARGLPLVAMMHGPDRPKACFLACTTGKQVSSDGFSPVISLLPSGGANRGQAGVGNKRRARRVSKQASHPTGESEPHLTDHFCDHGGLGQASMEACRRLEARFELPPGQLLPDAQGVAMYPEPTGNRRVSCRLSASSSGRGLLPTQRRRSCCETSPSDDWASWICTTINAIQPGTATPSPARTSQAFVRLGHPSWLLTQSEDKSPRCHCRLQHGTWKPTASCLQVQPCQRNGEEVAPRPPGSVPGTQTDWYRHGTRLSSSRGHGV